MIDTEHPKKSKCNCPHAEGKKIVCKHKTTRYKDIEVEFQDMNFKKQQQKYSGWIAQIIQHEIDHCEGIVI